MGIFDDILQGLPVNSVLREKVAELNAQKAAAETENAILKDDLRKAKAEIAKLQDQIKELSHKDDLSENDVIVLRAAVNDQYAYVMSESINLDQIVIEYHLNRLTDWGYLTKHSGWPNRPDAFGLTQKGRTYLVQYKHDPPTH